MKIVIIVEGKTEKAFIPHLRSFLEKKLVGKNPKLFTHSCNGHIYTGEKLKRTVETLLTCGRPPADHVIALTDVYTNSRKRPLDFQDATEAKSKMRQWVGENPKFHPHAAQHDFEAWLLPYWTTIQRLTKHNMTAPTGAPETVNHDKSPAYWIKEIFERGSSRSYCKERDASSILRNNDLSIAIDQCPELKAFINTILSVCGGTVIP